jgi:sulfhydrogenase subunit beta (sulfur reductase)
MDGAPRVVLTTEGLQALFDALGRRGYRVIGPTVRDAAIIYDDIASVADLPRGWTDEQDGGRYRLRRRDDGALFGYAVGPHSWKKYLHPATQRLWSAERTGQDLTVTPEPLPADRFAFIGVRACDLQAIVIQDRVLTGGPEVDPRYRVRRQGAFIVALNCSVAGGTCFCVSMQTGPKAQHGYDLALTELAGAPEHRFIVDAGSEDGCAVLAALPHRPATDEETAEAEAIVARTAAGMGRHMRADDVHDLLMRNLDHPRWDEVAARCLTCTNCTMVCPTCFCTAVEDSSDLTGAKTQRSQRWDSCFTMDFSYVHGGSVRPSGRSRYRQWMTHKLATWWDQFGTSGCVGCGRCITWCPVGIDITEEVAAIRASEPAGNGSAAVPPVLSDERAS